jgi:hypothetical protein
MSYNPILRLGVGAGHCGLALGGPGNQTVAEIDAENIGVQARKELRE